MDPEADPANTTSSAGSNVTHYTRDECAARVCSGCNMHVTIILMGTRAVPLSKILQSHNVSDTGTTNYPEKLLASPVAVHIPNTRLSLLLLYLVKANTRCRSRDSCLDHPPIQ